MPSGFGNEEASRQAAVPRSRNLHPYEQAVENFVPPVRASHPLKGQTLFGAVLDDLVTFAYGHEKIIFTPIHVVTDSMHRVIITDSERASVHVLDISGKKSFRIAGGPQRRLQAPKGVAVDGDDNIYVADGKLGLIAVFDSNGRFLRCLGKVQGESMFDSPTSIAIDRERGRLYVLDTTADELIVLDLQGKVLRHAGGDRGLGGVQLKHPTAISLWNDEIVILDRFGSHIAILDADCKPLNVFNVRDDNAPPIDAEVGLALDSSSNIYISNLLSSTVRIYRHDGQFLGFMRGPERGPRSFGIPSGLWIDSSDRLFVADTLNSRVQVFQAATRVAAASR